MDITEVARRSGVPAATLRFYEEKGSITSIGRGLRRTSDPAFLSGWRYCAGPFRRHYLAHVSRDKTGSSQLIIGSRRAEALGDVRGKAELSPTLFYGAAALLFAGLYVRVHRLQDWLAHSPPPTGLTPKRSGHAPFTI